MSLLTEAEAHVTMQTEVYTCICMYMECCLTLSACAARVTVLGLSFGPSVCLSVCYHVFCHYAQQGGQKVIPMGSVPHWLVFKNGDFRSVQKLWCEKANILISTASPRHHSLLRYNKGTSKLCIGFIWL